MAVIKANKCGTAHQLGDPSFENLLLDVVRRCEEIYKEISGESNSFGGESNSSGDFSTMEELGLILTFFDRYDHTYGLLSKIAFTDKMEFTEDSLRSLIGNKKAFEGLQKGLWKRLLKENLRALYPLLDQKRRFPITFLRRFSLT